LVKQGRPVEKIKTQLIHWFYFLLFDQGGLREYLVELYSMFYRSAWKQEMQAQWYFSIYLIQLVYTMYIALCILYFAYIIHILWCKVAQNQVFKIIWNFVFRIFNQRSKKIAILDKKNTGPWAALL